MSESVVEDGTGGQEGTDQGADDSAEDQEAQDLLDGMQDQGNGRTPEEEIAHWKKMARLHERDARRNSSAATKLREIEDSQKSDLQKALDAQAAAERERDAANAQTSRLLAAATHNLPSDLIKFIGDGSAEEIGESAEELAGIIDAEVGKRIAAMPDEDLAKLLAERRGNGSRSTGNGRVTRPVAAMRPGASPATVSANSPEDLFRSILNRDREL